MRSSELLSTAFLCKHTNYIIRSEHKGGHVHYHIHQIAKTFVQLSFRENHEGH